MSKFKVGDMVRIKSWEQMFMEYPTNSSRYYISLPKSGFSEDMKNLCGEIAIIEDIKNDYVLLDFYNKSLYTNWTYSTYMLEPCEDDSVDAVRYCINDLITTKECYEKIKEEEDMNKVVTLWYERKRKSIEKKYDKLREEFGEKQYNIIESFNELVDKFNNDLDGLFQLDKASEQFVLLNNAPNNVIKYKIDVNKLDDEFNEMYRDEIRKAYKKIDDTREEVEAQLSLSDDLKYQQEVLERYNIISKKTKKISD